MASKVRSFWKDGPSIFTVMLILAIVACSMVARTAIGKPADSIGYLGNEPQELVWKGEQSAVFRTPDGTNKLVRLGFYHDAPLVVGAHYKVMDQPIVTKAGWMHRFWLGKI